MKERFCEQILKKKNGQALTADEIHQMIKDYVAGEIPDYQMSAMLMAICFQGLQKDELVELTKAMRDSGKQMDLSAIPGVKVDKHSTGGVGDKTTLIIGPMVAALGVPVAKMSGAGLGFTGGTKDKLASIPGFVTEVSLEDFFEKVKKIGICVASQTAELAPADKMLYSLRDVTGTVQSIPLIASSIMSKKLAAGCDRILLDVTTGSGALINDYEHSLQLAQAMVDIGNGAGRKTVALLTNMDEPLGYAIGNNLEVKEAIEALHGRGPKDLMEVCIALAADMIYLAKEPEVTYAQAKEMVAATIEDGSAYDKFEQMVQSQGGDVTYIREPDKFPESSVKEQVLANRAGYINAIDTAQVGTISGELGAGRATKESVIDPSAGIVLTKKVGDYVDKGQCIAVLHTEKKDFVMEAKKRFLACYDISENKPEKMEMVLKRVES